MRRRDLGLLFLSLTLPRNAFSDQVPSKKYVGTLIGLPEEDPEAQRRLKTFSNHLDRLGWTAAKVGLISKWQDPGDFAQVRSQAVELALIPCDVILVNGERTLAAAKSASPTIPIVIAATDNPKVFGSSLNRPDTNVTGSLESQAGLAEGFGKSIGLLKELSPSIERIGLLVSPNHGSLPSLTSSFHEAAISSGVEPTSLLASSPETLVDALRSVPRDKKLGLVVPRDAVLVRHGQLIVDTANDMLLPAIYPDRFYVELGGLMSYGTDRTQLYKVAADFVDRILKGATPAQLPVQQPQSYELVINRGVAQRSGWQVPAALLAAADRVIG